VATVTTLVSALVTGISEANGLNDAGAVVGQDDTVFPFVWQPASLNGPTGRPTRLPILPTGSAPGSATAIAINTHGEIVGTSDRLDANGALVTRAVLWGGGQIYDLGTLIPDPFNPGLFLGSSRGVDFNDSGNFVGKSESAFGEVAFLFDRTVGAMRDLGSLIPVSMIPAIPDRSRATSINNNGDIVGVSDALAPSGAVVERAFLLAAGALFHGRSRDAAGPHQSGQLPRLQQCVRHQQ
jgi:probable HAF family extracellular repeat protein